jgi:integrase
MERKMAEKLTDTIVRHLDKPATGNRIVYDGGEGAVKGFGIRTTASGARSFVLNYRSAGRERRITLGSFPDWSTSAARDEAKALKRRVDRGEDPMGDRHAERDAPTITDLIDRYEQTHLLTKRPRSQVEDRAMIASYIRPRLGKFKVAELRHVDCQDLHRWIADQGKPVRANRTIALLSKMLSEAVKFEWCANNVAKGVQRVREERREMFLTPAQIIKLGEALAAHKERGSADAIRFLLLTGARRSEALGARWADIDLEAAVWLKPSAMTKQKKSHRLPLSVAAVALLKERKAAERRNDDSVFVFPGAPARKRTPGVKPVPRPLGDLKHTWQSVCKAAGLVQTVEKRTRAGTVVKGKDGKPAMVAQPIARLHDLRHTHASILASAGMSLPIIGALLGHTQMTTTARYSHLLDDPLRQATEHVGAIVTGAKPADIRDHPAARAKDAAS